MCRFYCDQDTDLLVDEDIDIDVDVDVNGDV